VFKVKKCISSHRDPPSPVFDSIMIPEWMESLHADDRRRESVRLAKLKRRIGLLDDLEPATDRPTIDETDTQDGEELDAQKESTTDE